MNQTNNNQGQPSFDALLPPQVAAKAQDLGVRKAAQGWRSTLALGVLGGAFIALGAVAATVITTSAPGQVPFGISRLLGGLVFCLGLILVVVAGAELFTGNNLIVMAWASSLISTRALLRNWLLVYLGNLAGALGTAILMLLSGQYAFGKGLVGLNILNTAANKCSLGFVQAFALGAACNALVCLAIWLCYSARSNTDKVFCILFPITAFVAAGFEHCVANMYFIPIALLVKAGAGPEFWALTGKSAADYMQLTWSNFVTVNLLPVTLGNIFGGSAMVGLVYWFIYIRKGLVPQGEPAASRTPQREGI